jgi:hypothetical protein
VIVLHGGKLGDRASAIRGCYAARNATTAAVAFGSDDDLVAGIRVMIACTAAAVPAVARVCFVPKGGGEKNYING